MRLLDPTSPGLPALHLDRGDEPVHVDLGPALLSKASVSAQDNNAYVVTCRATGARLLVDAADDAAAVLALLADATAAWSTSQPAPSQPASLQPTSSQTTSSGLVAVVTTHGHWDHHRALPQVVAATGAMVLAGRDDVTDLPVAVERPLDHGDVIEVGELGLDVVHLRGHTAGSVALVLPASGSTPAVAITGDSIFPGGVGNTWQDAERFTSLLDDVQSRLFGVLGNETLVLPGHGDGTTLGAQRPSLPQWRARGW